MFPILISIGPFKLYTYALVALIGFFAGLFIVWKRGRDLHYEEKELFDLVFVVLVWMFIGARMGYVVVHMSEFWGDWIKWINFVRFPGWYFPAGLVSSGISIHFLAKKNKWDQYQLMDVLVTGSALTQVILSLGAFFAGVGYGLPTESIVGLPFEGVYDRRFPVQLWEMVGYTALFWYLWWVESVYRTFSWYRRNRSQAETGFLVGMYLIGWGIINLVGAWFKTPELVWGGVRFDVMVFAMGILGGILLLLSRSGMTFSDMRNGILGYFGLGKTQHQKTKQQMENIRDLLEE